MTTYKKFILSTSALVIGLVFLANAQKTTTIITNNTFKKDTIINSDSTFKKDCDTVSIWEFSIIQCKSDKDNSEHHTTVVFGAKNKSKEELKDVEISWFGFELGWNNFIDRTNYGTAAVNDFVRLGSGHEATEDVFSLRNGKSVNVNIWPVWIKVNLVRHYLSLKTGLGIEMNNYRYTKNISYINDVSSTYIIRDSVNFRKNKLFTEYLTIPLLLRLETNPHHNSRSFRISAGPTFGYLVKSRTKQISDERGKKKNNDAFNLEKFRLGFRAELGYGPITFYGAYSFTPIHQYGLEQYPFSIGIVLIGNRGW